MPKKLDLTGHVYERWTVIGPGEPDAKGRFRWHCRCICGNEKDVRTAMLRTGGSRSCGCLAADIQRERITKYPEWPTRTGASSHVVEKDGKRQTLKEWAKELDIQLPILILRWNRGWTDDEILRPTPAQLKARLEIPEPLETPLFKKEEDEE